LKLRFFIPIALHSVAAIFLLLAPLLGAAPAQGTTQKPQEKSVNKQVTKSPAVEPAENPAQIELLETRIRFESNGDSRKEVHARVKINNELGARQFARLNFDYNRTFENIDIPLVRTTHLSGGTSDILPSAISDQPNPAVVDAPAYQDVRVKSLRILGLAPGDNLEYRVITTTAHHPLAPDFWLDHTFDRTGVVSEEIFELDIPASRQPEIRINPDTPASSTDKTGEGDAAHTTYRWKREAANTPTGSQSQTKETQEADVAVSTEGWEPLSIRLDEKLTPRAKPLGKITSSEESMQELSRGRDVSSEITAKAIALTKSMQNDTGRLEAIYDFVSQKIATIDLPLGATGFVVRPAEEILASGYATPEDKFALFAALAAAVKLDAVAALTGYCDAAGVPRPSVFKHLLISVKDGKSNFWLDPSLEVAPFGMVPPIPQKCVFVLNRTFSVMNSTGHEWQAFIRKLPFLARQNVEVDASLASDGKLAAKVHYSVRGDNELLLRVAFHQSPKEKWKEVAQLLSLSDGFRGQIASVNASDPYVTKEPFTVEYEISQPKFVDWSKKPVRIPAILPLVGLPDAPAKAAPGTTPSPIDLGTPLDVEAHVTLHLPAATTGIAPTGISVERDYATFSSSYSAQPASVSASRHLHFLLREIPAARAADYNAFLRAVQNDEAQDFTLERVETPPAKTNSAAPKNATSPKPTPAEP
jgi:hypothetical protein